MKKIILFLLLQIFFISNLFAANIDINTDKKIYEYNENITLNIEISSQDSFIPEINDIKWIDNFTQRWLRQSNSQSIVNSEVSNNFILTLILEPKSQWDLEIWPVEISIWDEIIKSEIINISVKNNSENLNSINDITENTDDSENTEEDTYNLWNTQEVDESSWNNIEFIEAKKMNFDFKNFGFLWIFIFLFFIIFYFILDKFLSKNNLNKDIKNENTVEEKVDINTLMLSKIEILSEQSESLDKVEFYSKLSVIFREYFDDLWIKNSFIKTFEELKSDTIDSKLFWMFEKSYYEEFNDEIDSLAQRKQIIMNIMLYLRK